MPREGTEQARVTTGWRSGSHETSDRLHQQPTLGRTENRHLAAGGTGNRTRRHPRTPELGSAWRAVRRSVGPLGNGHACRPGVGNSRHVQECPGHGRRSSANRQLDEVAIGM